MPLDHTGSCTAGYGGFRDRRATAGWRGLHPPSPCHRPPGAAARSMHRLRTGLLRPPRDSPGEFPERSKRSGCSGRLPPPRTRRARPAAGSHTRVLTPVVPAIRGPWQDRTYSFPTALFPARPRIEPPPLSWCLCLDGRGSWARVVKARHMPSRGGCRSRPASRFRRARTSAHSVRPPRRRHWPRRPASPV